MASTAENVFSCFQDRVVLITGAAGTIGGDSALKMASYGASLVLIDNHEQRLHDINKQLKDAGQIEEKILSMLGDVTIESDVQQLVKDAIAKFGKINYLINVVGVKRMGTPEATTHEALEENFTDIKVTFLVTKVCRPHLVATKGSVVNISSVAGLISFGPALPYGTAKAALNHMTKIFASDLAKHGVRVNGVCPSSIYSDFQVRNGTFKTMEENDAYFVMAGKAIPLGRVSAPSEVTNTILFLLSDASGFTTGAIIPVDGAYTLGNN